MAATTLNIKRVNDLPSIIEPNTAYFVAKTDDTKLMDMYIAGIDNTSLRHIISKEDIAAQISSAVSALSSIRVVKDIAARNALNLTANAMALVLDATADATPGQGVTKGGATYLWDVTLRSWTKISEYESMDMSLKWASIEGKPTSTVTQLDAAVVATHTHTNKDLIDKLSADAKGNLLYDGKYASTSFSAVEW